MILLLVVTTFIVAYVGESLVVGYTFFVFLERNGKWLSVMQFLPILFLLFVILDVFLYPVMLAVDATIIFHDPALIQILGPEWKLRELASFGFFDLIVWILQAFVAFLVGVKLGYLSKPARGSSIEI